MAYQLTAATIRTNNSPEGMARIGELWMDVASGKLPLLCDSQGNVAPGVLPVARYSNYSSDENGDYDLSVLGVPPTFFQTMDEKAAGGSYRKYEAADENGELTACTQKAWEAVWADQRSGALQRGFTADYECTMPKETAGDGNAHCTLYIAAAE